LTRLVVCIIIVKSLVKALFNAGVAELADAQDLKSCGPKSRTGSIPVSGTIASKLTTRGGAVR
jgi:hypothetical protein